MTRSFPKHLESYPDSGYAGDVAISLVEAWVPLLEMSVDDRKEALKTCQEILAEFEKEWADHPQAPRALFLRAGLERVLLREAGKDQQAQDVGALAILTKIEEKYPLFAATQLYQRTRAEWEKKE